MCVRNRDCMCVRNRDCMCVRNSMRMCVLLRTSATHYLATLALLMYGVKHYCSRSQDYFVVQYWSGHQT